jgi:hypothetical protein
METPAWPEELAPELLAAYARTAKDPVRRPATAAPAITALDGFIDYLFCIWLMSGRLRAWTTLVGDDQTTRSPICTRVGM